MGELPKQMNLQECIKRFQSGDESAFEELYTTYYTPLYRFIFTRAKDKADAEDLTQTVFLKIYRALPTFEDRSITPLAYFFRAARNVLIDHYRKSNTSAIVSDELIAEHSDKVTTANVSNQREVGEIIKIGLAILPDDQREIVEMKFLSELENNEISTITGKSEENIRQIQSRALRKMRTYLEEKHII